jgi:hypothetical protein
MPHLLISYKVSDLSGTAMVYIAAFVFNLKLLVGPALSLLLSLPQYSDCSRTPPPLFLREPLPPLFPAASGARSQA